MSAGIQTIRLRAHLNIMRRDIERDEKGEWVSETRRLLQEQGKKGTQKQIAEALGMSQEWVSKYDPIEHKESGKIPRCGIFYGYNVWGFKDESERPLGSGGVSFGKPSFNHGTFVP